MARVDPYNDYCVCGDNMPAHRLGVSDCSVCTCNSFRPKETAPMGETRNVRVTFEGTQSANQRSNGVVFMPGYGNVYLPFASRIDDLGPVISPEAAAATTAYHCASRHGGENPGGRIINRLNELGFEIVKKTSA